MPPILLFFIVVVVLELLLLLGLVWAYSKLHRSQMVLMGLRVVLARSVALARQELKHGKHWTDVAAQAGRFLLSRIPWWGRWFFRAFRWVGKITA